jgi:transcriptional regulator with XRE-family HTH domain
MTTVATGAPGVLIAIKRELHLTDEELARATGAGVRTIRRLLSDEDRPKRTRLEERIDDLRTIAQILREAYSAEATRSWLMARNRLLGFDRPIDRLGHGDFAAVRETAEAFVDGDYT